ncbi:MAG: pyridoxal phosphate-dependent aminotransferase [Polaromonas sp.]|nr:pyridoxal phosphate-dependent aminotransferase [Polaromonas sp.]
MRQAVLNLEESMIRQVANAGMGRADVLKFWFGESDEVTPQFIRDAATLSIQSGETFYAHNLGLPELREAIAGYANAIRSQGAVKIGADRIAVTSGGVNALMLAAQALVDSGDEVVVVTPVWPNLTGQPAIMGAVVKSVSLKPVAGQWQLDMAELLAAVTTQTRLLTLNAPNNPTGWTLSRAEQEVILAHCRNTGTWILADEVYERLYYDDPPEALRASTQGAPGLGRPGAGMNRPPNGAAPSFLDIAAPDDRLVVVNSFSKSFLMTGWRLGWLVMPPAMTAQMGKLIEFNTSCAPVFIQRAGLVAIERTLEVTPRVVAHLKACRDTLIPLLQALPGVQVAPAKGGMYAFFRLEDQSQFGDSLNVAKRLVLEAGLGLAPGNAFMVDPGSDAQGWLRWCFASQDLSRLSQGAQRLERWLGL